jgi:aryl-alcohol dehydrogenase-like predicted oxidoreductase
MRMRAFGRGGLQVSELGYGAWGISGKQWVGADDEEPLRALRRAIELGVNLIDTALGYGDGHSEQLVGRVVGESAASVSGARLREAALARMVESS